MICRVLCVIKVMEMDYFRKNSIFCDEFSLIKSIKSNFFSGNMYKMKIIIINKRMRSGLMRIINVLKQQQFVFDHVIIVCVCKEIIKISEISILRQFFLKM